MKTLSDIKRALVRAELDLSHERAARAAAEKAHEKTRRTARRCVELLAESREQARAERDEARGNVCEHYDYDRILSDSDLLDLLLRCADVTREELDLMRSRLELGTARLEVRT